jgi:hypothetical protein
MHAAFVRSVGEFNPIDRRCQRCSRRDGRELDVGVRPDDSVAQGPRWRRGQIRRAMRQASSLVSLIGSCNSVSANQSRVVVSRFERQRVGLRCTDTETNGRPGLEFRKEGISAAHDERRRVSCRRVGEQPMSAAVTGVEDSGHLPGILEGTIGEPQSQPGSWPSMTDARMCALSRDIVATAANPSSATSPMVIAIWESSSGVHSIWANLLAARATARSTTRCSVADAASAVRSSASTNALDGAHRLGCPVHFRTDESFSSRGPPVQSEHDEGTADQRSGEVNAFLFERARWRAIGGALRAVAAARP